MRIHARSLHYFDMIRRCGSIRGAARLLNITASAANRQLLALEEEVGAPLFERLSSGLRLTAAGELFAHHVITVLQDAQRLGGDLDNLRGLRRGSLHIMAVEGLQSTLMATLATRMLSQHPQVELTITSGTSASIFQAVASGDADIAIGFPTHRNPALHQVALARFEFVTIIPPDHPLAARKQVSFSDCARYPLILPSADLSMYDALQPAIESYDKPFKVALRTTSTELMKSLAASGVGVAFLTRIRTGSEMDARSLVHVPLVAPRAMYWEMGVYVRAGRTLPPALQAFAQIATEEINKRLADAQRAKPRS